MTTIRLLLDKKGDKIWSTTPEATVFEALQLLAEKNIGALLVLENGRLAGIVSERDYARKVVLLGKTSMDTPVREIMTENVVTVTPQTKVSEAMSVMTERHFRHLPVIEDEKIVGVISIGDLVKSIIAEQKFTINQLENYISGSTY